MTTTKKKPERMDPYFSVFNLHSNDAGDRADAEFITQWGQEKFDEFIKPHHDDGIMSIFNAEMTAYRLAWVTLVTVFANEDRA